MFKHTKISSVLILLELIWIVYVFLPQTAAAAFSPSVEPGDLIASACTTGPASYPALSVLKDRIAGADTLNQARTLALAPADRALDALRNTRALMPFSNDLRDAEGRLREFRSRILTASTPAQVADEFSGMMLAGLDDDSVADVNVGKVGCNYSTGEVIAIVIGLILGIIPGLILLVVLC
jgi:hypothetical protein